MGEVKKRAQVARLGSGLRDPSLVLVISRAREFVLSAGLSMTDSGYTSPLASQTCKRIENFQNFLRSAGGGEEESLTAFQSVLSVSGWCVYSLDIEEGTGNDCFLLLVLKNAH